MRAPWPLLEEKHLFSFSWPCCVSASPFSCTSSAFTQVLVLNNVSGGWAGQFNPVFSVIHWALPAGRKSQESAETRV